jgi:Right handed beta helix region
MNRKHAAAAAVGLAAGILGTLAVQKVTAPPPSVAAQIQALKPGATFDIPAGTYPGELVLHNPQRVTLRGSGRVTFSGGTHYAVKADGGRDLTLSGINFTGSNGHGLMAVHVDGLTIDHCVADGNAVNGFLTGDCRRITVTACEGNNNRGGHGCYLSERTDTALVQGCTFNNDGRCAIQANCHPGGGKNVQLIGNDCRNCPTAAVQVAGVKGGEVARNLTGGNRVSVVLWSDHGGQSYAPTGIDCSQQPGTYLVSKWSLKTCRLPVGVVPGRPEGE